MDERRAALIHHLRLALRIEILREHAYDAQEFALPVIELWGMLFEEVKDILLRQIESGAMPPEEAEQPSVQQRQQLVASIRNCMDLARARNTEKHGIVRRLTVSQYRNTLRDLLGIGEDFTGGLPPDGISKDGFTNTATTLRLSPLQLESYLDIAQRALEACLVGDDRQRGRSNA